MESLLAKILNFIGGYPTVFRFITRLFYRYPLDLLLTRYNSLTPSSQFDESF